MYTISDNLYSETAQKLLDAIDGRGYFSGSIEWQHGDTDCRLTISAVVYRSKRELPEGTATVISDIVPVWWEFHTRDENGEALNDFSFSTLREFLF